jgi:hypothetical protein
LAFAFDLCRLYYDGLKEEEEALEFCRTWGTPCDDKPCK